MSKKNEKRFRVTYTASKNMIVYAETPLEAKKEIYKIYPAMDITKAEAVWDYETEIKLLKEIIEELGGYDEDKNI